MKEDEIKAHLVVLEDAIARCQTALGLRGTQESEVCTLGMDCVCSNSHMRRPRGPCWVQKKVRSSWP